MTYADWINATVPKGYGCRGTCRRYSELMVAAFPELRLACGFVVLLGHKDEQHWWCVAPDGTVIDPTSGQFAGWTVVLHYDEVDLDDEVDRARIPTGKCMNCGEFCYGGRRNACSPACDSELSDYFDGVRRHSPT